MKKNLFITFTALMVLGLAYILIEYIVFNSDYKALHKWRDMQSINDHKRVCQSIPAFSSYATKSDYFGLPSGAYFVKSKCYYDLAYKSKDPHFCQKVWKRYSLLLGSSHISQVRCLERVQEAKLREKKALIKAEIRENISKRAIQLSDISVFRAGENHWRVRAHVSDGSTGQYRMKIDNISSIQIPQNGGRISLKSHEFNIWDQKMHLNGHKGDVIDITISRKQLERDHTQNPLDIYSIVATLELLTPSGGYTGAKSYKNFNIKTIDGRVF